MALLHAALIQAAGEFCGRLSADTVGVQYGGALCGRLRGEAQAGTSNTHTKSLADDVEYEIKKRLDIAPEHIEGRATGWILLDYGTVIVHLFQGETREYYNLERLWQDASVVDLSDVLTED